MGLDIKEIKADYIDSNNNVHIDVYFDEDTNSEGHTVAILSLTTFQMIYFDKSFKGCTKVCSFLKKHMKDFKNANIWDFVESNFPNYDQSDEIAKSNDLQKLLDDKHDEGDGASWFLEHHYNGDIRDPSIKTDLDECLKEIYEQSIVGFLDKMKQNLPHII
ncbi:MAG: hypothetical protein QM504_10175 [Pseudomonadota bacterium]